MKITVNTSTSTVYLTHLELFTCLDCTAENVSVRRHKQLPGEMKVSSPTSHNHGFVPWDKILISGSQLEQRRLLWDAPSSPIPTHNPSKLRWHQWVMNDLQRLSRVRLGQFKNDSFAWLMGAYPWQDFRIHVLGQCMHLPPDAYLPLQILKPFVLWDIHFTVVLLSAQRTLQVSKG